MQLTSQVLMRNMDQFSSYQNLLLFGLPETDDLSFLDPKKVLTFDYRVYLSHQPALGACIEFSCQQDEVALYDAVVIFLPKSKAELDLVLAFVSPMLQQGASIYLVGEKKAGIASAARQLDQLGGNHSKIDSAKHCQLWHVTLENTARPFKLVDWFDSYSIELNGISLQLATLPGVFSFGRLDPGTELLLNNMFTRLKGRVLDFGCGNGVIGAYTKRLNPDIDLELVDINCLALECAKRTCELNHIEARIYPSNGWSDVAGRVDALISNPPFHSGVRTEYQTAEHFIRQAKQKLTKQAPFLLVANSFLKYRPHIEAAFERCDVVAETTRFKVYKTFR